MNIKEAEKEGLIFAGLTAEEEDKEDIAYL